ncbi:hypothetical protein JKP88DRAFT_287355 [Tribonema minus]|uniref:Uncharacterized protein n=1 Tax=Tribonema minus TaxID=303371 RepID=A0A835ZAJ3_9STRA|nr:hypothetical protein JKP88DRAFT_287355 [Tribonema minus]
MATIMELPNLGDTHTFTVEQLLRQGEELGWTQPSAETTQLLHQSAEQQRELQEASDRFAACLEKYVPLKLRELLLQQLVRPGDPFAHPTLSSEDDAPDQSEALAQAQQAVSELKTRISKDLAQLAADTDALAADSDGLKTSLDALREQASELAPNAMSLDELLGAAPGDAAVAATTAAAEAREAELQALCKELSAAVALEEGELADLEAQAAALSDEAMRDACADMDELAAAAAADDDAAGDGSGGGGAAALLSLADVPAAELEADAAAEARRARAHAEMAAWYTHATAALETLSGFRAEVVGGGGSGGGGGVVSVLLHFDSGHSVALALSARGGGGGGDVVDVAMAPPGTAPPPGLQLERVLEAAKAAAGGEGGGGAQLAAAAREARHALASLAARAAHVDALRESYAAVAYDADAAEVSVTLASGAAATVAFAPDYPLVPGAARLRALSAAGSGSGSSAPQLAAAALAQARAAVNALALTTVMGVVAAAEARTAAPAQ